MDTVRIDRIEELQDFLRNNTRYANGKNQRVDHLYATVAQSRFLIENVFGIYLTIPTMAWMAVWIAVTSRAQIKKRHLKYCAPHGDDAVGSLVIGGATRSNPRSFMPLHGAYLYLFDTDQLPVHGPDLSIEGADERALNQLLRRGYTWQKVERHGQIREALMPPDDESASVITLDSCQAVVVQTPTIVPSHEVFLTHSLMHGLARRVRFDADLPGRDYISW